MWEEYRFLLKGVYKSRHVVSIAYGVVNLNRQRQKALAVPLKKLSHGKDREQIGFCVIDIDVKGGKGHPREHAVAADRYRK